MRLFDPFPYLHHIAFDRLTSHTPNIYGVMRLYILYAMPLFRLFQNYSVNWSKKLGLIFSHRLNSKSLRFDLP